MSACSGNDQPGPAAELPGADAAAAGRIRAARQLEPWSAPFALVNGSAVGLVPILLPVAAIKYSVGHAGLVMGGLMASLIQQIPVRVFLLID